MGKSTQLSHALRAPPQRIGISISDRSLALERALNRSADRVAILGTLRRDAHRGRQRLKVDRRIDDVHADEPASLRIGVAQRLGDVLQDAIAAVVEDDEDRSRLVMRGAPQSLRRIHGPAVADERGDPAIGRKRRADRRRHAAAEHAAASEEIAARLGCHEILDAAEGRGGIVGDDRILRQRVDRCEHGGVGAEGSAGAFRQNVLARRFPGLAPPRASRGKPRRDLVLIDQFREALGDRRERAADVAEERHVRRVLASERLRDCPRYA